jgi:hypothetical protein
MNPVYRDRRYRVYRRPGLALALFMLTLAYGAVMQEPTAAHASPSPQRVARFYAAGTHGYKIALVATVDGANSPVRIVVEDFKGGAEYETTGTVTSTGIHASFGQLGDVALRFHPSGRVLHSRTEGDGCTLRDRAHLGTFIGTFRFRGEGEYTRLTTHRVSGGVGSPHAPINEKEQLKLGCPEPDHIYFIPPDEIERHFSEPVPKSEISPGVEVVAVKVSPDEATVFIAGEFALFSSPKKAATPKSCLFMALREEIDGPVSISRQVFQGGPVSQCPYEESSGSFSAAPDAPFIGTAVFQHQPDDSDNWLGSLAVPFLGLGAVPLAGPEFKSELIKK